MIVNILGSGECVPWMESCQNRKMHVPLRAGAVGTARRWAWTVIQTAFEWRLNGI